jgi:hypothetical protein
MPANHRNKSVMEVQVAVCRVAVDAEMIPVS